MTPAQVNSYLHHTPQTAAGKRTMSQAEIDRFVKRVRTDKGCD